MVRESEPRMFRGQGISRGRGQNQHIGYFSNISSSISYKQEEVKVATSLRKKVYTYLAVKDVISKRV